MRMMQIVLAALMLGLVGGYGWSAMSRHAPPSHIPKAVTPAQVELPQTADDRQWAARSLVETTPPVETGRVDPTIVEQSVYYATCGDARAAGSAPLHSGEPGYREALDSDGDGIACEAPLGR
jgi:hypothetical protein